MLLCLKALKKQSRRFSIEQMYTTCFLSSSFQHNLYTTNPMTCACLDIGYRKTDVKVGFLTFALWCVLLVKSRLAKDRLNWESGFIDQNPIDGIIASTSSCSSLYHISSHDLPVLALSIALSLSLSLCLSFCLSIYVSLSVAVSLSLSLSVAVSLSLSLSLCRCLSLSLYVCLPACDAAI